MSTLRRLILVSLMVLLLCPFASNAQTDEESMLEEARRHFSDGNFYFATTWLERLLLNFPATPQREEVLLLMSKAYASTGRDEKAAEAVRNLMKDYPKAAASLNPDLLKLAGYGHPPESSTPATAVPFAPAEPAGNKAASPLAAEPAAAPAASVPAVQKVQAPAVPPLVTSPPPVAVPPSAPTEPTGKTVPTPPTVEAPAAPAASVPAMQKTPGPAEPPLVPSPPPVAVPPSAPTKPSGNTAAPPPAAVTVTYTLEIGEYAVKSAMADARRKIKKTGLLPVVEQGPKRNKPMTRLYFGEFSNQATARKEQNKLRAAKADSFFLMDKDRRIHVYAGSYIDQKGAEKEQQRLAALGIKLSLKQVVVPVSTYLLTAGSFPTRETALEKAVELEKQGVKAVVIQRSTVIRLH